MRAFLATAPPGERRRLIGCTDCRLGGRASLLSREGLPPRPREMSRVPGRGAGLCELFLNFPDFRYFPKEGLQYWEIRTRPDLWGYAFSAEFPKYGRFPNGGDIASSR